MNAWRHKKPSDSRRTAFVIEASSDSNVYAPNPMSWTDGLLSVAPICFFNAEAASQYPFVFTTILAMCSTEEAGLPKSIFTLFASSLNEKTEISFPILIANNLLLIYGRLF